MNKTNHFLAIMGSAFIIASCQNANSAGDALTQVALAQSAVDTVPKKSDTMPTGRMDTTAMGIMDTTSMGRADTTSPRYVDLRTGQPVELYYDPKGRRVYSTMTNEPVDFYVDMNTGDTIYGRGRYVVNNYLMKGSNGMYRLDPGKVKMDKNEIKIKEGNKKFKMDKSNMKMKEPDYKMKGDTSSGKMKSGKMKSKMNNGSSKNKES
jgi:phosphodiesterase/alkaline phosphatase D-like protein